MDLEDCLIIIIAVIMLYMVVSLIFGLDKPACVLALAPLLASSPASAISPEKTGGSNAIPQSSTKERPDNLEMPRVDPFKMSHQILGAGKKQYDEYDDDKLLREIDPHMVKSFDNIVIDGNNFVHRYRDYSKSGKQMTAKDHMAYIKKSVKLISSHFPDKNLYFVFKDPENDHQEKELMAALGVDSIKKAHKKFFGDLAKEYSKVRFVIAYGDAKYRDDYAAIWLADTLPDDTILLSRDRYRDVAEMASAKLRFNTYGKRASAINKIINKPFNFVTKGAVKAALVGYSFSNKTKSGFYDRMVNHKSPASDSVYIFKV